MISQRGPGYADDVIHNVGAADISTEGQSIVLLYGFGKYGAGGGVHSFYHTIPNGTRVQHCYSESYLKGRVSGRRLRRM